MDGNTKANAESQMQVAIGLLLETIGDKSSTVVETVDHSLRKIAKNYPNEVLKSSCQYCERQSKNNNEHIPIVLKIIKGICEEYIVQIDGDTVLKLIALSINLMTQKSTFDGLHQLSASSVLVALGKRHGVQVMDALLKHFQPHVMPHYTIVHTMGALASTNVYSVIPYLKSILETMMPLLNSVKVDILKTAFAYSLECFAESLIEYTSNPAQAPDPTLTIADFQPVIANAYEILFASWLNSREPKVVEKVLNALTALFAILNPDKIRQHTVKTTQTLLNLYKRHKDPLPIVKCLVSVISVTARTDGTLLEPSLSPILLMLSDLVCISPDYAQPELLRTHSEVLRCFECFAMHYSDYIIDHVLTQIKNNNEKERVKGLLVLTHLTNSSDNVIRSRLKDIVQVLTGMMSETNLKVKMVLMKVIVAFAYKGFLVNNDPVTETFILFMVKLCCKQPHSRDGDFSETSDLQITASNTLYVLTTSVKELELSFWDLLLNCLVIQEYFEATIVILRCLTHLSSKRTNVSSCEGAFVRCLAILAQPLPDFCGMFALNFLKNIKLSEEESCASVWDTKIPHLLKYLEQNYENFIEKEWEDLVFDFLALLLENSKRQTLQETLVERTKEHLYLYNEKINAVYKNNAKMHAEKRFLLKSLAVISCYIENETLVKQVINIILGSVKTFDQQELQSCAEAMGICSRTNYAEVLRALMAIRDDVATKKLYSMFKFPFMKEKAEVESERVKFLVLSSYVEMCFETPIAMLLQNVECEMLEFALHELTFDKDFVIKKACLATIGAIANAMHPNRNKKHIYLHERDAVIDKVTALLQLHNGPEYIQLFPVIIQVLAALVRLPHPLETEPRVNLLKLCFDNVFNASAIYCKFGNDDGYGDLKLAPNVSSCFGKVNTLVQDLLLQSLSPATLDEIVTLLEPWLTKKKVEQRLPALEALRYALQAYLDNVKFAYEGPSTFSQTGLILARIVPRCTDPNKATRKVAVDCVHLVLCIAGRYEGRMRDHDKSLGSSLAHVQEQITTDDSKLLFNLTTDLAHVVALNVPKFQLTHFVEFLFDGLLDLENSSSNGASVVLNNVVKMKGGDLATHVTDLMTKILEIFPRITSTKTKSTTLCAIMNLATHHLKPVVHILLQQPLPYDRSVCSIWAILSTDKSILIDIIDQLKKILKSYPFYEEQRNQDIIRIATLNTLQAISTFNELFKSSQSHDTCKQDFAELFGYLYVALASYVESSPPIFHVSPDKKSTFNRDASKLSPFKVCLGAFRQFLQNAGAASAAASLLTCDDSLGAFLDAVPKVTENVCVESPQSLASLVGALGPYIRADVEFQRVAVAACFSSLLKQKVNGQVGLAEIVLEMLIDVQNDPSMVVRKLCLQGLGHAAECLAVEIVYRHCAFLLNAFMQGLDYNSVEDSDVVLQAMVSFSKLLNVVGEKHLNQCQVTAAVRIKPLLQHDNSALRQASFRLLGDLANSIKVDDAFSEQVQGNLITLLLHLYDEDPDVVKACKYAMRKTGAFLNSHRVNTMIQEHILEEGALQFAQFVTDFVKVLSEDVQELLPQFINTCLSYYKSPLAHIRGNAALITGLLYAQLNEDFRPQVSFDTVSYRLLQLLKDENQDVRARGAEAIAYLFTV